MISLRKPILAAALCLAPLSAFASNSLSCYSSISAIAVTGGTGTYGGLVQVVLAGVGSGGWNSVCSLNATYGVDGITPDQCKLYLEMLRSEKDANRSLSFNFSYTNFIPDCAHLNSAAAGYMSEDLSFMYY